MKAILSRNRVYNLLFFIIPLALLVIGWHYIQSSGLYFLRSVDPEYGYLLNGVLLACGKPDVQFITNPGVPVHYMVAMVSFVVHLFRPLPLIDDVLTNPELYIRATLYTINVLNAIAVFLLGCTAYRLTKNVIGALFLQLMLFTNLLTLEALARLMPESLMGIIICCWLMVLLRLLYKKDQGMNYHRYSLIFGLLFAIGLADKLTFLPFFLLPLILLPGWKNKLTFAGYSLLFFLVFAFPVTLNHQFFTRWVTGMFTHTGSYGGGDAGFVNWSEFADHLALLLKSTPMLLWSGIALALSTLLGLVVKKQMKLDSLQLKLNLSLLALIILQFLMASKHFAYHYMNPSILLTTFIVLMVAETLKSIFPVLKKQAVNIFLAVAGVILFLYLAPKMTSQLRHMQTVTKTKTDAWQQLAPSLKGSPKIISPSYYGCSAVEYALTYGLHVSGKHGNFLFEHIKKHYPSTYLYFPWGKVFYEGNREIDPALFIQPSLTYTVYIAEYSQDRLNDIIIAIQTGLYGYNSEMKMLSDSRSTNEAVFLLSFIASKVEESVKETVATNDDKIK